MTSPTTKTKIRWKQKGRKCETWKMEAREGPQGQGQGRGRGREREREWRKAHTAYPQHVRAINRQEVI